MGLGEEMVLRARAEAAQLPASSFSGPSLDALRGEAAALFAQLPEPPAYRRACDPARERASELLPMATELLGRAFAAQAIAPEANRAELLARALEAHVRALAAISAGEIALGDDCARQASELSRAFARAGSLFEHRPQATAKAWDPETGTSRYDPAPEQALAVQLYCPNQGCQRPATYQISPRHPTHHLICVHCSKPFTGHFAELQVAEARSTGTATHYALRTFPLGGGQETLEFDDVSAGKLAATRGDLLALLYAGTGSLAAVENLTSGQVLWTSPKGTCFLATAVYGEGAAELEEFRRFRDRVLLPRAGGRALVRLYYGIGPWLARAAGRHAWFRRIARHLLDGLREVLRLRRSPPPDPQRGGAQPLSSALRPFGARTPAPGPGPAQGSGSAPSRLGRPLLIAGIALALVAGAVQAWREAQEGGLLAPGTAAPALVAPRLDGSPFALDSLRGKVVLLSFWATWCAPCQAELPMLRALAEELRPRGLELVAANVDDQDPDRASGIARFLERPGAPVPLVVFPPDQAVLAFQALQLPTLYVIGRDGRVVAAHEGLVSESRVRREVEAALLAPASLGGDAGPGRP